MAFVLGKGVFIGIGDGGGPETFNQIINCTVFTPPATTWKTVDVTSHNSTTAVTELVPTIRTDGKLTLTIMPFDETDTYHQALRNLSVSGALNNFRFTYPGGQIGSFDVAAYVTSFTPTQTVDGIQTAKFEITPQGTVSDDAAALASVAVTDGFSGAYVTGNAITLAATFDEIVKVTGTPRISVVLGSGTVFATYASGSNTNVLNFSYTFGSGDHATATHFSISSPVGLNSGTINDLGGNAATLTFTPPTTTSWTVN